MTLLELEVNSKNLQLFSDELLMQKRSSNKTSQACTCLSIRHPFFFFLSPLTHTHSLPLWLPGCLWLGVTWRDMSSIIWHSCRLWTVHLLKALFPKSSWLVFPRGRSESEASRYRNQLIDTHDPWEPLADHSFHCSVFHGWFIFDQYFCLLVIPFPTLILHMIFLPVKHNTSNLMLT